MIFSLREHKSQWIKMFLFLSMWYFTYSILLLSTYLLIITLLKIWTKWKEFNFPSKYQRNHLTGTREKSVSAKNHNTERMEERNSHGAQRNTLGLCSCDFASLGRKTFAMISQILVTTCSIIPKVNTKGQTLNPEERGQESKKRGTNNAFLGRKATKEKKISTCWINNSN